MTAKRRARMTGNEDFYEETGKLYCRPCCKIVDHLRQGSIERHKESEGHKRNILKKKKQITLKTTFKTSTSARLHNVACVTSWAKACTSANIPLNACVGGSMREFFEQHVKNGGSIPTTAKCPMPYLNLVLKCFIAEFKTTVGWSMKINSFFAKSGALTQRNP